MSPGPAMISLTTSRLPGLTCPYSTHLPLITLPAAPHHHRLLIPLTPATLSGCIVCTVYVLVFVVCTPGINAQCCRLYVSRFLYISLIPVLFFALLAFLFLNKVFHLQLDPDHCLHGDFSQRPVTPSDAYFRVKWEFVLNLPHCLTMIEQHWRNFLSTF